MWELSLLIYRHHLGFWKEMFGHWLIILGPGNLTTNAFNEWLNVEKNPTWHKRFKRGDSRITSVLRVFFVKLYLCSKIWYLVVIITGWWWRHYSVSSPAPPRPPTWTCSGVISPFSFTREQMRFLIRKLKTSVSEITFIQSFSKAFLHQPSHASRVHQSGVRQQSKGFFHSPFPLFLCPGFSACFCSVTRVFNTSLLTQLWRMALVCPAAKTRIYTYKRAVTLKRH